MGTAFLLAEDLPVGAGKGKSLMNRDVGPGPEGPSDCQYEMTVRCASEGGDT